MMARLMPLPKSRTFVDPARGLPMNKQRLLLTSALLAIALAACSAAPENPTRAKLLKDTAASMNAQLPKPYVDGLVQESVRVDDSKFIIDIRIPDVRIGAFDPKKLPAIHRQEQQDVIKHACNDKSELALLDAGATVVRHFIDQDRQAIFDVAAVKSDCSDPAAAP